MESEGCIQMQSLEDLGHFGTLFFGGFNFFLRYLNSQHQDNHQADQPNMYHLFSRITPVKDAAPFEGHPHTLHLGCITCRCHQRILKNQTPAEGHREGPGRNMAWGSKMVQISHWPNRWSDWFISCIICSWSVTPCLMLTAWFSSMDWWDIYREPWIFHVFSH